jgi:cell division transport system ATP-binding protein
MIELYHVSKSYQGRAALDNVNLRIDKGEFVYLTGSSGAGKTTLLRLVFRAEIPDEGQVLVNGLNLGELPKSRVPYLRRSMGIIFQDFRLFTKKTVFDNVAIALKVAGMSEGLLRVKVAEALRVVGLDGFQKALPFSLSAGEQQRVCLARAIVNNPLILLADEPTSNLDPTLAEQLLELLRAVNLRGTTVIVATHDPNLIRTKRRLIRLDQGCVVEGGLADA